MFLRITSPEGTIFEGNINKVSLPTQEGEITILPGHIPLSSVVVPGLVKINIDISQREHFVKSAKFLFDNEDIVMSVSRGLLLVDGQNVIVATSAATTSLAESQALIEQNKKELEEQIAQLKAKGSVEDIEKALLDLEKIKADLKLYRMKGIVK